MTHLVITVLLTASLAEAPSDSIVIDEDLIAMEVKKKKKKGKKIGGSKGKKSKKGFFSKIFGSK